LQETQVAVNFQERVDAITPQPNRTFEVRTTGGAYRTNSVLLAIGRRGTPRKLDVPGEDLSKVVYRLVDPAQYQGQSVIVVGGGDSAIEAAISIAEQPDTKVTLSYRGDAFNRTKLKNRKKIEKAVAEGHVVVHFKSTVKDISADSIRLKTAGGMLSLDNDAVIVCAGGILPTGFLKDIGIKIETKHGQA
jgi:thioredoxin reductase (NADPH)